MPNQGPPAVTSPTELGQVRLAIKMISINFIRVTIQEFISSVNIKPLRVELVLS
jgi:hypothetical protein